MTRHVQREIVARAQTGRAEIARECEAAARLTREITAEIEAQILGSREGVRELAGTTAAR